MMSERVTQAAVRYVAAMEAERETRRARGASVCEHVAPDEDWGFPRPPRHPDGGPWQELPCWRFIFDAPDEDGAQEGNRYGEGSARGWCASCEARQKLHDDLHALTRARVGALASLRAAVRALPVGGAA